MLTLVLLSCNTQDKSTKVSDVKIPETESFFLNSFPGQMWSDGSRLGILDRFSSNIGFYKLPELELSRVIGIEDLPINKMYDIADSHFDSCFPFLEISENPLFIKGLKIETFIEKEKKIILWCSMSIPFYGGGHQRVWRRISFVCEFSSEIENNSNSLVWLINESNMDGFLYGLYSKSDFYWDTENAIFPVISRSSKIANFAWFTLDGDELLFEKMLSFNEVAFNMEGYGFNSEMSFRNGEVICKARNSYAKLNNENFIFEELNMDLYTGLRLNFPTTKNRFIYEVKIDFSDSILKIDGRENGVPVYLNKIENEQVYTVFIENDNYFLRTMQFN